MKEKNILVIICIFMILVIAVILLDCGVLMAGKVSGNGTPGALHDLVRRVQTGTADFVLLIDPGHGGMDGGASGSDGTLEKDINLAVSEKLAEIAEQYDCCTILTRETDEWLCETEEGSIRSRKTADLMARREMIKTYAPDITVSIHLNSFKEDPDVRGAQVFYPAAGGDENILQQCRKLAETMQNSLNETLQQDEPRTAMTRDGVFIFKEVERPLIIIECGFMSNPDEAGKLKTDKYQRKLARCIMDGIVNFSGLEKTENMKIVDSRK